jgi:hypothetical protein
MSLWQPLLRRQAAWAVDRAGTRGLCGSLGAALSPLGAWRPVPPFVRHCQHIVCWHLLGRATTLWLCSTKQLRFHVHSVACSSMHVRSARGSMVGVLGNVAVG